MVRWVSVIRLHEDDGHYQQCRDAHQLPPEALWTFARTRGRAVPVTEGQAATYWARSGMYGTRQSWPPSWPPHSHTFR